MYKPHEPKKVYWTIGEVAKELGVSTAVLRDWDKEFKDYIGFIQRSDKRGSRRYTERDIEKLKNVKYLMRGDKIEILRKLDEYHKQTNIDSVLSKMRNVIIEY